MHKEIEKTIEELNSNYVIVPKFIEVEDITESQVIIAGEPQNSPCDWGIVEKEGKWIFFECDWERGYICYSEVFNSVEEACCFAKDYFEPRLTMYNKRHEKETQVDEFEQLIGVRLPREYRKFLIEYYIEGINRHLAEENVSITVDDVNEQIGIDALFDFTEKRSLNLLSWYKEYEDELPEKSIIIGNSCGCGVFVLIWQEDWKGVFLWDRALVLENSTEEECLYRITDNFDEFIKKLRSK